MQSNMSMNSFEHKFGSPLHKETKQSCRMSPQVESTECHKLYEWNHDEPESLKDSKIFDLQYRILFVETNGLKIQFNTNQRKPNMMCKLLHGHKCKTALMNLQLCLRIHQPIHWQPVLHRGHIHLGHPFRLKLEHSANCFNN